jgi:methylated-DNA-[protein]-cysteine S-methyltransferase
VSKAQRIFVAGCKYFCSPLAEREIAMPLTQNPRPQKLVGHTQRSSLGWIGIICGPAGIRQVTFGQASQTAVKQFLENRLTNEEREVLDWDTAKSPLVARLQKFADGEPDDFQDVELDFDSLTPFQQRVLKHCRQISYGSTMSYGELADRAGNPGAARAVGSTMAANCWPLIVPCHRVVQAGGQLGNYSAPQGVRMKRRLLDLEAAGLLV